MAAKAKTPDNPNLVAYKALVGDQVLRLRSEDGLCDTAISRSNREIDLGVSEAYDSHYIDIPLSGMFRIGMPGYGAEHAKKQILDQLKAGRTLSVAMLDFVPDETATPTLPALPEGAEADPDVIAYKERVRAFVVGQVDRGNVYRSTVNPRLVNVGIEPIDGPKQYEYLIQVNPTTVARYSFIATGEEAAQVELARLIQQDKDRGYIDPSRLRVAMPAETPAPVLAQEPVDA